MNEVFVPKLVYDNILIMVKKYRKLDIIDGELSESQLRKNIQYDGFINLKAVDGEGHRPRDKTTTYISLMGINSKYIKGSADFTLHVKHLTSKDKGNIDLIMVSSSAPSSHIKKKITTLSSSRLRIFTYTYDVFKCEKPLHVRNSPHILLDPAEAEKVLAELKTKPQYLPKIRTKTDHTAIWHGFEPGDIILVDAISDISLRKYIYMQAI